MNRATLASVGAVLLAGLAARWPVLALPAVLVLVLVAARSRGPARLVVALAGGALALIAVTRFTVEWAAPNIVGAGRRTSEEEAVSRLREIAWAQERVHEAGAPPALLAELVGDPGRPDAGLAAPPLASGRYRALGNGVYRSEGYAFTLYIIGNGWVSYAWPAGPAGRRVFLIDEQDRICESDNPQRYLGPAHPPPPNAAPATGSCGRGGDGVEWRPWRHHRPRPRNPGK